MRNTTKRIDNLKQIGIWTIVFALLIMTLIPSTVSAETMTHKSSDIPVTMKPSTVIRYVNNNEFIIVEGSDDIQSVISAQSNDNKIPENALLPHEEYPMPERNMIIYYGTDGEINHIEFPVISSEERFTSLPSSQQKVLDSYIEKMADESVILSDDLEIRDNEQLKAAAAKLSPYATWGSYPNKMYIPQLCKKVPLTSH